MVLDNLYALEWMIRDHERKMKSINHRHLRLTMDRRTRPGPLARFLGQLGEMLVVCGNMLIRRYRNPA